MSQWGAKGQADAGRTAPEILGHYYQGSALGPGSMPGEVRVGLLWDVPAIDLAATGSYDLRYGSPDGELVATGSAGQGWKVATDGSGALIASSGDKTVSRPSGKSLFVLFGPHGSLLRMPQTGNRYKHGILEINTYQKGNVWLTRAVLTRINVQQYLYGLGEVPSLWPPEALRAQAIAARTYGVEKLVRLGQTRQPCNCGLYPSTIDQVYVGFEKEGGEAGDRWKAAVDATDGQILTINGRLIEAVYHSSSGGHTENNEFVWGGPPLPYLRGVPDPWDVGPRRSWSVRLTQDELAGRLNTTQATAAGSPTNIEVLDPTGVSGRVRSVFSDAEGGVRITGTAGTKRVSGAALKKSLGLLSTLFWQGEPRTVAAPSDAPPPGPAPAAAAPPNPAGQSHPNGTLIKGDGPNIYLIQEGKKHPFASPGALTSRFPKASPIILPEQQVAQYPDGPKIGYRDGSMITHPGPPVWLVTDGQRRRFASGAVLDRSGYPRGQMRHISIEEVHLHPEGPSITNPEEAPFNGTLVKGGGPTVYLIEAGGKRPIATPAILESRYTWKDVLKVTDSVLNRFPEGPGLGFPEGTLIRTSGGETSVISDQKRRPVSPEKFEALKFQPDRVRPVSDVEAQVHQLGDPL